MKKLAFACLGLLLITGVSCKDAKKGQEGEASKVQAESSEKFNLVKDSTKVSFTAYKTTEKLPVGGMFTAINITDANEAGTAMEVLDGAKFSIPVSSLFTNDATETRDPKILEFFFGVMTDTELISGVFKVSGDDYSIDVTLNGQTGTIPLDRTVIDENNFSFAGIMNLEDWDALDAVASINKACEVLHTGADGVSKTWSEVAVKADVHLQKN